MIKLTDLGFAYSKRQPPLFQDLNLDLPAGTICGMLGANGAGKSTLLKLLAGLSFPQQGHCEVLGFTPSQRRPDFLADIFLLPEEIDMLPITASVYVQRYGLLYPRFDAALFHKLMADFSLSTDRKLTSFSYGQKKKFLLAFGIATHASLLIMDEPTNGLDIPGKNEFRRAIINHFSAERSFIISTHQVHDLQGLIDSVMIIAEGRILLHQTLDVLNSRLQVQLEPERPDDALYVEESLEGFRVIRANGTGLESNVDLALLFGLVTSQNAKARELFALEGGRA